MYVEKVKWKKYMFDSLFISETCFDFNLFFGMQKYFIKIILEWEIIMKDKFWFNWKFLSGLVDIAM